MGENVGGALEKFSFGQSRFKIQNLTFKNQGFKFLVQFVKSVGEVVGGPL